MGLGSETAMQDDLFGPWMPGWLNGETLFGLCSRYHRVAGHRLASMTCQRLFGHPRAGLNHDLPGRLDEFVKRTNGQLGSAEYILLERTVLAYYLRFRPEPDHVSVLKRLREFGPGPMKASLGWLATRMGASHPLRACPACIEESVRAHGTATWMLLHQLPGVWICPSHGEPLLTAQAKANGVRRFQWILPDDVTLCSVASLGGVPNLNAAAIGRMQLVAESTIALLATPRGFVIEPNRFARACLSRLIDRRLAAPNGRLRPQFIGPELAGFLGGFAAFPEHDALCVGASAALYSLRRLLQPGARFQHPLRCILTALWLFGTWREFMEAYTTTDLALPTVDVRASVALDAAKKPGRAGQAEQAFLHLVCDQGLTIRSAAKMVGIDVQTGLNWAARARILIRRRPKKLDPAARKRVISALRRGAPKQTAADLADISIVTVTRILCSEPGLRDAWRQKNESHQHASARSQLLRAVRTLPGAGIKEIRSRAPAAYAWLYRNDRAWLDAQTTTLPRKVQGNHPSIDWDARDAAFAQAVDAIRQALSASLVDSPSIRAVQLARLVPGLRLKLRHLDRMPLTRVALGIS